MIVGIGDMETIMRRQSALTVTRSTLAALTRMAKCTGMEIYLFQKATVTAADATVENVDTAQGWVARTRGLEDGVKEVAMEQPVTMWTGGDLMEKPCEVCHARAAAWTGKATRWRRDFGSISTFATNASVRTQRENDNIARKGMVKTACATVHCTPVRISVGGQ